MSQLVALVVSGLVSIDERANGFGRPALLDDLANRVTLTENTVGIMLPRIATSEHRTNDIDKKLALLDRRLEKIVQRRNLDEDVAEHDSWLGPVGPAAGTQSLSPSESKQESDNPFFYAYGAGQPDSLPGNASSTLDRGGRKRVW